MRWVTADEQPQLQTAFDRWKSQHEGIGVHPSGPVMAALIASGSILSWLLNRDAGSIALASFVAFAAAATVDAIIYHLMGKYPRWLRINGSNVPSALVDSLIFPTLAFGSFLWPIVLGQFAAKTLGGFVWSLVFRWLDRRAVVQAEQG